MWVYTDDFDRDTKWGAGYMTTAAGLATNVSLHTNVDSGYSAESFPAQTSSSSGAAQNLPGGSGNNFPAGFGDPFSSFFAPTNFSALTTAGNGADHAGLGPRNAGRNPVVRAKLLLNGHDRFSERLGSICSGQ